MGLVSPYRSIKLRTMLLIMHSCQKKVVGDQMEVRGNFDNTKASTYLVPIELGEGVIRRRRGRGDGSGRAVTR